MAVIFVLLSVLVGVAIGDAVLENTGPVTVTLFNRSFTELTQGQFLGVAAGAGALLLLFLATAATSSQARRLRRRERATARRGLGRRLQDLERENASLRKQLGAEADGRWPRGRPAGV
jgi:hypothetical protein